MSQPRIIFQFGDDEMIILFKENFHAEEVRYTFPSIKFTPELDALLKQLESKDID
jgi:hypothetical protein